MIENCDHQFHPLIDLTNSTTSNHENITIRKANNNDIQKIFSQGLKQFQQQQFKLGRQSFFACIEKNKEHWMAHYYLGVIEIHLKNFDNSLLHLQILLDKAPKTFTGLKNARLLASYIFVKQKKFEDATKELSKLSCDTNDSHLELLCSMLGFIAYKTKNYKKAKEHYQKLLEHNPENPQALNGLGIIYLEIENNPDKGLEYCSKALQKNPLSPAYLDSVGYAHYKKNNIMKAMEFFKEAFKLSPENTEIKTHINNALELE